MNPNVERLEALLARVQHNRTLPRPLAAAPRGDVSPTQAKAAPLATPIEVAPKTLVDVPLSLDATVDDAVIVAETKSKVASLPPSTAPVLELEPHAPKSDVRTSVIDLDDPGTEPLPDPDLFLDDAAPTTTAAVAAPAPVKRPASESQLASAVQTAADEEPRTEPPTRAQVLAPIVATEPKKPAELAPVAIVPAAVAAASGPIVKVLVAPAAPPATSFVDLVRRSTALRPR